MTNIFKLKVGDLFLEIEVDDNGASTTSNMETPKHVEKKASSSAETNQKNTSDLKIEASHAAGETYNNDYVLAAPSVRHIAKLNNINLKNIKGTGKDGRINKEDIQNFLSKKTEEKPKQAEVKATVAAPPLTKTEYYKNSP